MEAAAPVFRFLRLALSNSPSYWNHIDINFCKSHDSISNHLDSFFQLECASAFGGYVIRPIITVQFGILQAF